MNQTVTRLDVEGFPELLAAYREAGVSIEHALDGGAGAGHTASQMLRHISGEVYAFEPFPGNHKFFADAHPRVHLLPFALADSRRRQSFHVGATVKPDSEWGRRGMEGYSSVGELVAEGGNLTVECVRADDRVDKPISFVKLDLQGGELDALRGMPRILAEARLLWIEYTGQPGLLELLARDFVVYDTDALFWGDPTPEQEAHFDFTGEALTTSVGTTARPAIRRLDWPNYEVEFIRWKGTPGLVQTDLVCIPKTRLDEFARVRSHLR